MVLNGVQRRAGGPLDKAAFIWEVARDMDGTGTVLFYSACDSRIRPGPAFAAKLLTIFLWEGPWSPLTPTPAFLGKEAPFGTRNSALYPVIFTRKPHWQDISNPYQEILFLEGGIFPSSTSDL